VKEQFYFKVNLPRSAAVLAPWHGSLPLAHRTTSFESL
jgi:hypothetical protein